MHMCHMYVNINIIYIYIYNTYRNCVKRHDYNLRIPRFADVVFRMAWDGLRSATCSWMRSMYSAIIIVGEPVLQPVD